MSILPCPQCGARIDVSRPDENGGFVCPGCGWSMTPVSRDAGVVAAPGLPQEWELLGKLGEGGMGVVCRARHRLTRREVAIKCVTALHGDEEDYRSRFEREVIVLDRLDHPKEVRLLYAGIHAGRPWLAMELVDGGT